MLSVTSASQLVFIQVLPTWCETISARSWFCSSGRRRVEAAKQQTEAEKQKLREEENCGGKLFLWLLGAELPSLTPAALICFFWSVLSGPVWKLSVRLEGTTKSRTRNWTDQSYCDGRNEIWVVGLHLKNRSCLICSHLKHLQKYTWLFVSCLVLRQLEVRAHRLLLL